MVRLARMHDVVAGYVIRGEVPGIVTLVSRRGEVHADAIGMKALGGGDPMRRDDVAVVPGRYGWDGGYGTSWYADPREDMHAILLTQHLMDSPVPPPVYLDFWTSAYQAIGD